VTANDDFTRFGILPNSRMSGSLELQMRCWVRIFRLLQSELMTKTGLPLRTRIKAWKSGFSSRSWLLYNLAENVPELYIPDLLMAARFYKVNGFFNLTMGNKLLLSRLLAAHGIPQPAIISTIIEGRLIEEDRPFDANLSRALTRTLERSPRQVFRPTWSGAGQGVFFLSRESGGLLLNGKMVCHEHAVTLLSRLDRYIATEQLEQADYAREIFSGSTNTIRMLTLWDADSGESLVAAVSHRFGTSRSAPIDNFHQGRGGVCASIHPESGAMGKAMWLSADHELICESAHPETGAVIEGVVIPDFEACIEGMRRVAGRFPFCPCIGWDVVISNNGWQIIEANPTPGLSSSQVHTPLLKDPRARRVFERWGLVPERRSGKPPE